jgi:hypothetical protein
MKGKRRGKILIFFCFHPRCFVFVEVFFPSDSFSVMLAGRGKQSKTSNLRVYVRHEIRETFARHVVVIVSIDF